MQLLITHMLLADLSVTLLMLLQFYWISLGAFLAVLLILPLSLLSPFPAGLNALFSKKSRRVSLARIYVLWNATSVSNIVSYAKCTVQFNKLTSCLLCLFFFIFLLSVLVRSNLRNLAEICYFWAYFLFSMEKILTTATSCVGPHHDYIHRIIILILKETSSVKLMS